MAWVGLGPVSVATPGTKVKLTVNKANPNAWIGAQAILIQAFSNASHTNSGRVYLYDANGVRIATLAVPTANSIPTSSGVIPNAPGPLNVADFSIDADNANDGVDASYTA